MAKLVEHIGDYTAIIEVTPPGEARLSWFNGVGKKLRGAPKIEGDRYQREYSEIKSKFKSIKDTLRIQTRRIESFYLDGFKTSINEWLKYYVDHPLIHSISGSLVWSFEDGKNVYSAILRDKKLIKADGTLLDRLPSDTLVSLWHPLLSNGNDRDAWRNYIWENAIVQPFRQVFREVYVESPKKSNQLNVDGLYVRQHQFRALLLSRGWRYQLRGSFESDSTPVLKLRGGISCEIGISGTSVASSDAGISLAIKLAKIRFLQQDKVLSRSELQPIEYSEVMRDIDLFTSVAGLGYQRDWDQIEETFSEVRESRLMEKIVKIKGQTSIICNELILDNDPLENAIVKFLCALDISMERLPIPETVKTRSLLLGLMLKGSTIVDKISFDDRYVHIDNADGGCRINLSSGLVFSSRENRLLPVSAKCRAIANEAGKDTMLSRIYSLILMYASDTNGLRKGLF